MKEQVNLLSPRGKHKDFGEFDKGQIVLAGQLSQTMYTRIPWCSWHLSAGFVHCHKDNMLQELFDEHNNEF